MTPDWLRTHAARHVEMIESLDLAAVEKAVAMLADARDRGRIVFACGNGGSAASASHLSVDLGKCASLGRAKRFRVVSLVENVAWITAIANDAGYENVFVEQMAGLASPGDVLVAISVTGSSPNVVKAAEYGSALGMTIVALTGPAGGRLAELADHVFGAYESP